MRKILFSLSAILVILFGLSSFDAHAAPVTPVTGGGTQTSTTPLSGQILIGNASNTYTVGYVTCVSGCTIATSSGGIAITGTGGSGGGVASTTPFVVGNLVVVSSSGALSTISSGTYYLATNPSSFPSSSGGSSTYVAVYCGTTALCGNSGLTFNSSTLRYSLTGGFPVFSIKNTSLSQFAGSGMYFLNGLSDNQGGVAFYSGINDAGDTQGFFTIDETDGNGGGTGHLVLFNGTSSVLFYPSGMFAGTLNASGTITQSGVPVLTGNQTTTLTGAVTGSGATTIATLLANSGVASGTYTWGDFTVASSGIVTSATAHATPVISLNGLTGAINSTILGSGNITSTVATSGGNSTTTFTLTNSGVASGTYNWSNTTVASSGIVTAVSANATPVTSNIAGTGISVSGATGAVTISNTGVTSFNTQTGATVYNISCTSGCSVVTSTTSGAITVTGGGIGNIFVTPTSSVLANNEVVYASNGSSTVRATSSIYSFTNGDNTFGSSTDNGLLSVVNASNTQTLNISTSTNNTTTLNIQGFTMFSGSSTVTTPSIGGAIVSGGCDSATTTVDSSIASSTAVFLTTPTGNPGTTLGGTWVYSYLLSAGLIQTNVCSNVSVTPNSIPYVVKIIK